MRAIIILEHRFDRAPDGTVWTQTMFGYPFWRRYLAVFDSIRVVTRLREIVQAPAGFLRADGQGVTFVPVPCYLGPWQYLRHRNAVQHAVHGAVTCDDAVIMRAPSNLATILAPTLWRSGHPYAVEVVGDPYDVFAPAAVKHPLRPIFRWWFPRRLRRICASASAAAYVTESALQRRYPPAPSAFTTHYSSVELPSEAFAQAPRSHATPPAPQRLVHVGSMAQMYKSQDVLLDALGLCIRAGLDLELAMVGDGRHRPDLEARARRLGLEDRLRFLGQVPSGAAVRAQLDAADLFVLPSRQEGLPRALIEATARGLPCIASTVGGIPELLPPEDMVPPGDAQALAAKIAEVLRDPQRMSRMSQRNLNKAQQYRDEVLCERRNAFYAYAREQTDGWLKQRK